MQRTVTVALGDFSLESLDGTRRSDAARLGLLLLQAIHYYLADGQSGRAERPYPSFLWDGQDDRTVEVRVRIDSAVWDAFSTEAERQGVSTDQLLQHAAFYFAADRDAGRLTEHIADDLDPPET